jgi:hypothetical protein
MIAVLIVAFGFGLFTALRTATRKKAEADARAAWRSQAEQTGCFIIDSADAQEPDPVGDLINRLLGSSRRDPTFQVYVPNVTAAELVTPLLSERTDIQLVNHHLEDVPAASVIRMKAVAPKTYFRGYNPPATWPSRMGRHMAGKDFNGAPVTAAVAPGQRL